MSLLNWTTKRLSRETSLSPSRGSEKTRAGGSLGRSLGGGGGAASAVGVGASVSDTDRAWRYTTLPRVSTWPTTSSQRPVSRFRLGSRAQPAPFGFLSVTQTA